MSAPPSPLLALRAGLAARLAGADDLAALMGGRVRLYDEPPAGAPPVYATFGDGEAREDPVGGARRHRHALALVVHAAPGSLRDALAAAEIMARRLDGGPLSLDGHALVFLAVRAVAAARDPRTGTGRATLTLEAVTEVLDLG